MSKPARSQPPPVATPAPPAQTSPPAAIPSRDPGTPPHQAAAPAAPAAPVGPRPGAITRLLAPGPTEPRPAPAARDAAAPPPAVTAPAASAVPEAAQLPSADAIPPGAADDPAPPPGRAPAGDARSLRWRAPDGGDWFTLIYRDGAALIVREGRVGFRGEWTAVVYPRAATAARAYANRCARAIGHGFVDL